jgi:hypothetical protein
MDTIVLSKYATKLLDGKLTDVTFYKDEKYYEPYSLDATNYFTMPVSQSKTPYSGYFIKVR